MNTSPEIQNHITQSVELIKPLEVLYRRKNTARGLDTPWFGARLLLTRMKESLSYVMGDIEKILEAHIETNSVTLYPSDAVHLLSLLETVTVQLAEGELNEEEIPWAGLQLTLSQTKEALMSVQASLVETRYERQSGEPSKSTAAVVAQTSSAAQETQASPESAEGTLAQSIEQETTGTSRTRSFFSSVFSNTPESEDGRRVGNAEQEYSLPQAPRAYQGPKVVTRD